MKTPDLEWPKQFTTSHSEMASFKRCKRRWHLGYVLGFRTHMRSPALVLGSVVHKALEEFYEARARGTRGPKKLTKIMVDVIIREYEEFFESMADVPAFPEQLDKFTKDFELGKAMVAGYVPYALSNDDFTVAPGDNEISFDFSVSKVNLGGKKTRIKVVGRWDRIIKRNGIASPMEDKTASQVREGHLPLDFQCSIYSIAARRKYQDCGPVLYNTLRKQAPGPRVSAPLFSRAEVWRPSKSDASVLASIRATAAQMYMVFVENTVDHTPTHDCAWDCDFYDMCQMIQGGFDPRPELKRNFRLRRTKYWCEKQPDLGL